MNKKINFKIIWKAMAIGALVLVMWIPLLIISGTIDDRLSYKNEAARTITDAWGGPIVIAALATTGLLTAYIKAAVMKDTGASRLWIVFGAFAALYGYLYVLLLLQDAAFILGAVGLFAGLAAAMFATKNIKWYEK